MERKPPRRTRERILELSLRLFNDFGEPNVNTTLISDEMNISPGNLYYHFKNKDDIINCIFQQFEREIDKLLSVPQDRTANEMRPSWRGGVWARSRERTDYATARVARGRLSTWSIPVIHDL